MLPRNPMQSMITPSLTGIRRATQPKQRLTLLQSSRPTPNMLPNSRQHRENIRLSIALKVQQPLSRSLRLNTVRLFRSTAERPRKTTSSMTISTMSLPMFGARAIRTSRTALRRTLSSRRCSLRKDMTLRSIQ